jgi:hypothetical protein
MSFWIDIAPFSCTEARMTDASANLIALLWRIVIAGVVIAGRLALDRLAFRGTVHRQRRGRRSYRSGMP